ETTRRFHVASWAFIMPARSPTRGSGEGAVVDMLTWGDDAQAAEAIPTASDSERSVIRFGIGRFPISERVNGCGDRCQRWNNRTASIFCMRSISVVWSAKMSDANL